MDALEDIPWLDPLVERREAPELIAWVKKHGGTEYPHTGYLADCPWMLHADVYLDEAFVHITDIAPLIYLTVSRDNSCRFCYGAARFLMRLGGMSEAEIVRVERDLDAAAADPKLTQALDFARKVSRSNPAPGEKEKAALRAAGYDELAIKELAFEACDVVFHNRMGTLLALPPIGPEVVTDKSILAWMREEFAQLLKQSGTPAKPEKLSDALKAGPFSNVVVALDGILQARMLRTIIDEAWASPHLPVRTKALIFAVIARGLGSKPAEREAYRILAEEGLATDRTDAVLAHLAGPELDDLESRLLPYARETIWYQAPTAQRLGRELRAHLSNAQFLEAVGIAALANLVCRLPLVLNVE